jgi:hypothetical protein
MRRIVVILALAGCSELERVEPPAAPRPASHGAECGAIRCAGALVCCESEYEIGFVRAKACEGKSLLCEAESGAQSCLTKPECVRRIHRNRTRS